MVVAMAGTAVLGPMMLGSARPADAHPLGNATVNHYDGFQLYPDRVEDTAVEDIAEIPNLQRQRRVDTNADGTVSPAERTVYAGSQCRSLAAALKVAVAGQPVSFAVAASSFTERPGAIHLSVGRLVCRLTGPADLSKRTSLTMESRWDSSGIGWHEITAVGHAVTLQDSPFPATSISNALLRYPNDMLSSPLDVRSGTVHTTPGPGTSTYTAGHRPATTGFATRALNGVATTFNRLVGARHLTVGVGLLAVALSMLLGAGHAFLPGHGKTIMAAYLVGRRGRLRDVVLIGATVTITHTAGVLVLGLLISVTSAFAPTAAEQSLAIVSGLIVTGVGAGLLLSALRRRRTHLPARPGHDELHSSVTTPGDLVATALEATKISSPTAFATTTPAAAATGTTIVIGDENQAVGHDDRPQRGHVHHHGHSHAPEHSHGDSDLGEHANAHHHPANGPDHLQDPSADHEHPHRTEHSHEPGGFSRGGLLGLGVAGGLVPSPSALLVLLAAIALGRTAFGVVLVLGYGLGMAGAFTAAGLLLVQFRNRLARAAIGRRLATADRLLVFLPYLTAALVCVVGIGLTLRAFHGII